MEFRIAETFTDSLGWLTGDEQKTMKTPAFDLPIDPASTGMKFRMLNKMKGTNFWSVRVNADFSDRAAGTVLSVATNSSNNDFRSGVRYRVCGSGVVCMCAKQLLGSSKPQENAPAARVYSAQVLVLQSGVNQDETPRSE